ncbi:MAG: Holliday junction resolvase RuvX [Bacteroidota bacterium]
MTEQKRILGVDYGTKRIGLAVSDPLRILASAYATVENSQSVWSTLKEIVAKEDIEFAVVGMPLNLKGEEGVKATEVRRFIEEMKECLGLEVVVWDERFTTSLAYQYRLASGMGKKRRRNSKERIDAAAAAIMLQGFLDSVKKSINC